MQIEFNFVVAGSPKEVADRLRAKTRFRMIKHMTTPMGQGEFAGRVKDDWFSVAPDPRNFIQRQQAIAEGTLTAEGSSTRVTGTIALPRYAIWTARFAFVFAVLILGGSALMGLMNDLASGLIGITLFSAFITAAVVTLGWQMNNGKASMEPLLENLRETLGASMGEPDSDVERMRARPEGQLA